MAVGTNANQWLAIGNMYMWLGRVNLNSTCVTFSWDVASAGHSLIYAHNVNFFFFARFLIKVAEVA